MGHKSKRRGGKVKMSKGPPKISRNEEENQSLALFESSIPSATSSTTRSKNVQRVYDEDSFNFQEASSSSGEDSSESEVDAAKQLMAELGAADSEPTSSDDSSQDESEDDLSGSEDDLELSENDLVAEDSESEGMSEANGELVEREKRSRPSGSETHTSDLSGSSDELSLAESSDHGLEETAPDMKPPKKKSKPLDNAVDPDDIQSAQTDAVKKKPLITETIKDTDNFAIHFERDMDDKFISEVTNRKEWTNHKLELGALGHATYFCAPSAEELKLPSPTATLPSLGLRSRLFNLIGRTLKQHCKVSQISDQEPTLNPEQRQLFHIINQYKDLYSPRLTFNNMEEYRLVYCMHALNHVLKTRLRVTLNSEEKWSAEKKKHSDKEYRDQGLTRPKVLILAPFKESARRIVNMFESLLMTKKKSFVTNKKRFTEEFSPPEDFAIDPKKPEDYSQMFEGNTDDCFRLGVQLSKSGMKLYADFYKADILVCSPLGLRMILGAEGDEKRDYDFMSSIEVLIMDQTDAFLMQNWDHVLHVLSLLHVQPKESRDTDFSRIRMWTLNGHSRHYRQTIVQSSVHDPLIAAIFARHCSNYSGEVRLQPLQSPGSICHIATALPLIFQRFPCTSYSTLPDDRFNYFINEVLPQYTDKQQVGTLIYIPSYYDYVRIRNHLSKHKYDTSLVCEYASDKAIRRAKKKFYTKETHFMLYTERVHFFRRMQLRKIRHLIFYSLPTYPQFFSDVCNMYRTGGQADASCLVLFSNHEAYKLSACVGTERTRHMISAKKNLFMFVTGDE